MTHPNSELAWVLRLCGMVLLAYAAWACMFYFWYVKGMVDL